MASIKNEPSRRALGRGLESLLPERQATAVSDDTYGRPLELSVDLIDRNSFQTRTRFDEALLQELATSIAATGVIQPIVVRRRQDGRFELITGERRLLASRKAGKTTIPAILAAASDEQAMEMTIVENLQRADLNPMEQARAYQRLSQEFKMTQEQMAARTGKERTSVTNFLRLLKLPDAIQGKVEEGILSFGHARALLSLQSPEQIQEVAQRIVDQSLSVRQTENCVQGLLYPERGRAEPSYSTKRETQDVNVQAAQDKLQRALGLKVKIEDRRGKGRVIIEYARLEDFDTLLDLIVGERQGS